MKCGWLTLGAVLGLAACTMPSDEGEARFWREAGYTKFEYAKRPQARLHLYLRRPEVESARATVLLLHGGGWAGGAARDMRALGDRLVEKGYAAVIPSYRVHGRHLTTPADAVEDAVSAYAFVVEQADRLGVDPARIALWGRSVGAHLAFWIARSEVAAVARPWRMVFVSGVVDTSVGGYHPPIIDRLEDPLSPADSVVADLPPLFLLHGGADHFNNISVVEQFVAKWRDLGNEATLRMVGGLRHGFYFDYDGERAVLLDDGTAYPDTAIEFLSAAGLESD
jgi:acetyl esterase/lipase